ncbi:HlyD family secretion protein [Idiomarina loihiensis]|uniref:HlyD family secretion protein n=1 Tax=Idiomarina loihiensis TaxID=135577 RepID=UPI00384BA1EA
MMSNEGLFRNNAIKAQANKLDGDVIVAQPVSATVLTSCLLAAVAIAIVFLASSSFNRKETVSGFLQPDSGISRIAAPRNGVISDIYVNDGEVVKKGQPLILLKTPEYLAGGESLSELISGNLIEQVEILKNRAAQTRRQSDSQKRELEQRIKYHTAQLRDMQEQQNLLQERLDLNKARLTDMSTLSDSGLLATDEVRQQQELILNARQQLAELRVTEQSHESQLEQLSGELARLPDETDQQLSVINSEITRLEQQQLELGARSEILITAPVGGVVTNLIAEIGQQVQPSGSLVTVLPNNTELKAMLLIPTRAYGFIKPGQNTKIRFDAFPHQRFGLFDGKISRTSKSIVLPNEIDMPVAIQEPVYRVEATLTAQEIRAYGESMPLQAGMLLSADVVLEQRSLLAWLFEPLLSLKGRI